MERRSFLKLAPAVAAVSLGATALSASEDEASRKTVPTDGLKQIPENKLKEDLPTVSTMRTPVVISGGEDPEHTETIFDLASVVALTQDFSCHYYRIHLSCGSTINCSEKSSAALMEILKKQPNVTFI